MEDGGWPEAEMGVGGGDSSRVDGHAREVGILSRQAPGHGWQTGVDAKDQGFIGSLAAPFLNHLAARGTMTGPTLVDQLEAHHIPWAAYFQGLPRPCSPAAQAGHYSEAVDPFMHAARVRDNPGRLPGVVFVVPDLDHDMHSGPVRVADAWLHHLVGELAAGPVWGQDTRLVVTFDESRGRDVRSCCDGLGRGGRIATIAALAHPAQAAA